MRISKFGKKDSIYVDDAAKTMTVEVLKEGKINVSSDGVSFKVSQEKDKEVKVETKENTFNIDRKKEKIQVITVPGLIGPRGKDGEPGKDGGMTFIPPVKVAVETYGELGHTYADGIYMEIDELALVKDEKKIYKKTEVSWAFHRNLEEDTAVAVDSGGTFGGMIFMKKDNEIFKIKNSELTAWEIVGE